jgi:hypothetical protein
MSVSKRSAKNLRANAEMRKRSTGRKYTLFRIEIGFVFFFDVK